MLFTIGCLLHTLHTHLFSATLRHFSTISAEFQEEAEAGFVQLQFYVLICRSL